MIWLVEPDFWFGVVQAFCIGWLPQRRRGRTEEITVSGRLRTAFRCSGRIAPGTRLGRPLDADGFVAARRTLPRWAILAVRDWFGVVELVEHLNASSHICPPHGFIQPQNLMSGGLL